MEKLIRTIGIKNLKGKFFNSRISWYIKWGVLIILTLSIIIPQFLSAVTYPVFAATSPWTQTDWSGGGGHTSWTDNSKFDSASNITVSTIGQITLSPTSNWYNTDWKYRRKITFDNSAQAENLVDFPVLVKLNSSRIDYSNTQNLGQDIRFTDSDGTTLLSYEIEKWDETGDSFVWVKVPQINASSNTDYIYIYHGNISVSDDQNPESVWNDNYVGVWHFSDSGPDTVLDSTSNNNDGTQNNGVTFQVASIMGDGFYFTETSSEYVSIPDSLSLDITSALTMEAWVKPHFDETDIWARGIIDKSIVNNYAYRFLFHYIPDGFRFRLPGYTNCDPSGTIWEIDTWHYITGTFVGGASPQMKNYFDSVIKNTCPTSVSSITNTDQPLLIGDVNGVYGDTKTYDGMIDEIRISDINRSDDWITASFKSSNDTFNTYSSGEERYASSGVLTSSIYDTGEESNWGTIAFTFDGGGTTEVKVRTSDDPNMTSATDFSLCTGLSSGSDISLNSCVSDGHRYIQYQISLSSVLTDTPVFQDVFIIFSPTSSPTPTPTTTPTVAPSSLTAPSAPVCNDTKPKSAPWLYGASAKSSDSVLLQFTEVGEPVSEYVLEYGPESGKYQFAMANIGGKGTTSYQVASLTPNTTYHFRVRAGNGCAIGDWSNEISAKTYSLYSNIIEGKELETEIVDTEVNKNEDRNIYTVKVGDSMYVIAIELFGDPELYLKLIELNKDKYPSLVIDPSTIQVGWELLVPPENDLKEEEGLQKEQGEIVGVEVMIKVVDEKKIPVKGANVTLYSTPKEAVTNDAGIASFENVEPGEHKAVIAYEGYSGEQNVFVPEDQDGEEVDYTIQIKSKSLFKEPVVIAVIGGLMLVLAVTIGLFLERKRYGRGRMC